MTGVFIVLEGIDGSGTTTQAARYAATLRAKHRAVHVTREPSDGPIGSLIRLVLNHRVHLPPRHQAESLALLFAADRLDHLGAEILPHLDDGSVVISDRYDLSSLAYQSATTNDPHVIPWLRSLNSRARRPDLTLVLDVPAELAAERRNKRGGAKELFDDSGLQARLADLYRTPGALIPGDRTIVIDGTGTEDDVLRRICAAADPLVG